MKEQSILEIKNLSFRYPDYPGFKSPLLFDSLNLKVQQGSITLIAGRPDSGKTSLSRIIAGLLPRFSGGYIEGEVRVNGVDVFSRPPHDNIELIGLTFQSPEEQLLTLRCDTEVAFPLESLGVSVGEMKRRVQEALDKVGLSYLSERDPSTLSGGEQKRLLVAVLLAVNPALWILDEIFEELDPWFRKKLIEIIKSNVRDNERGVVVFTSKWIELYGELCSDFVMLKDGKMFIGGKEPKNFKDLLQENGMTLNAEAVKSKASRYVPETGATPVIMVKNLSYTYRTDDSAKESFKLEVDELVIHEGETVSIVGRNGSGKTTLAKLICGLLEPEKGEISIQQNNNKIPKALSAADARTLNAYSGYLFQNPDYQIFLPTVEAELSLGLKLKGLSRDVIESTIAKAIRLFNLPEGNTPPAIMGFGAKRRLQAAIYYFLKRNIMIMDEVDSGLAIDELLEIIDLFKAKRMNLILITHNIHFASLLSHKIIYMENGRIEEIFQKNS